MISIKKFTLGDELSFFIVDTRSRRDPTGKKNFLPPNKFKQLQKWIRELKCPGVLIINQPLLLEEDDGASNANYDQFKTLVSDITGAEHDF